MSAGSRFPDAGFSRKAELVLCDFSFCDFSFCDFAANPANRDGKWKLAAESSKDGELHNLTLKRRPQAYRACPESTNGDFLKTSTKPNPCPKCNHSRRTPCLTHPQVTLPRGNQLSDFSPPPGATESNAIIPFSSRRLDASQEAWANSGNFWRQPSTVSLWR